MSLATCGFEKNGIDPTGHQKAIRGMSGVGGSTVAVLCDDELNGYGAKDSINPVSFGLPHPVTKS
jgi:hypothetical protein